MKVVKTFAVIFGVLTLVAFLAPFALQADSDGAAWGMFLLAMFAWYIVGPVFLIGTTIMAAVWSVLHVRDAETSDSRRRVMVRRWVATSLIEVVIAVCLLALPHVLPEPIPALIFGLVVTTTGISTLVVALHVRAERAGAPAMKMWHVVVVVLVSIAGLMTLLMIVLNWVLTPADIPAMR
ncbi:hypothetical protein [Leucobacter sp. GX24907]